MEQVDEKKLSDLFNYSTHTRGMIISQTIMLERNIDEYLCCHFSYEKEKQIEMMDLVFGSKLLPFDFKKQIFVHLLSLNDNIFLNRNKKIDKSLTEFIRVRNILAHYILDTTPETVNAFDYSEIKLIKFAKQRDKEIFHHEVISSHLKNLDDTIDEIIKLNQFIKASHATLQ
ncbi:hypothetical protein [Pedobacter cryotolerans]|uniref:Uncharacterized protein n=1 Tax=Pedobacter cryotolerans TaxID=2571270 RepID=A0A4U1CBS8_9SPHI|nr:hypothetical protein [Pedobacter cryotolerans]TKC03418.1 hypothetical protein FA045_02275 [Pedobacter cryotolerans]